MRFTMILLFVGTVSSLAQAKQKCGGPLAGHSFCNEEGKDHSRATFKEDCGFSFSESGGKENLKFEGVWRYANGKVHIESEEAGPSGERELIFSKDFKSYSAKGYEHEIYHRCD